MLMYDMIMFCNKFTTCMSMSTTIGRSLRVVFNYCMTCASIIKPHVIALLYRYVLAIVVEAIVGETTPTLRWRSKCCAGDDGDRKHKMMMAISCHIFLLQVMFILYASYFA